MKKSTFTIFSVGIILLLISFFLLKSCIIQNTKPNDCEIVNATITSITEGTSYDIVFRTNKSNSYYINRGIEQGLNLDSLKRKVLNKTVTLHLARIMGGVTSNHISQMALGENIIFTEFKN
ncbi:hypothetical protein [Winogradskyella immobilis]|uniref:DUF4907 domain-containing protein n=1 Tax=Winogradskyella immobilis TaxID=2816852 RepID=A0ABS8EKM6_9FLAO|nr:hypothetical protein [Winogradskyella immobilis]MCC1483769.1 hypothetical protein [Winogradskyella immobilis]MCG0015863.1 hypothetical protein [Winogradskyella immobilis]